MRRVLSVASWVLTAVGIVAAVVVTRPGFSVPEYSTEVDADTITVQRGDTLYGLARQHMGDGARWKDFADYNGITNPARLQVGQVLVVPR